MSVKFGVFQGLGTRANLLVRKPLSNPASLWAPKHMRLPFS
jgi:hypothetical protein